MIQKSFAAATAALFIASYTVLPATILLNQATNHSTSASQSMTRTSRAELQHIVQTSGLFPVSPDSYLASATQKDEGNFDPASSTASGVVSTNNTDSSASNWEIPGFSDFGNGLSRSSSSLNDIETSTESNPGETNSSTKEEKSNAKEETKNTKEETTNTKEETVKTGEAGSNTKDISSNPSETKSVVADAMENTSPVSTSGNAAKAKSDIKLLPWFGEVENIFAKGDVATVIDVETGLKMQIMRTGGTNHADSETINSAQTAILKTVAGGEWNWTRRPVIVEIDGYRIAASLTARPHAGRDDMPAHETVNNRSGDYGRGTNWDSIKGNSMDGHFDIHFYGSRTHCTNHKDPEHQAAVQKAFKSGL